MLNRRRSASQDTEEGGSGLIRSPRKKSRPGNPLVHHGRHFGRTVHALCNVQLLIRNSILRLASEKDDSRENFSPEEEREHEVFKRLLQIIPRLSERLLACSDEESIEIAELIQKGISGGRSDDTKSLKGAVLDWITPQDGILIPPLSCDVKSNRGYHHVITGGLLCPAGMDWSDLRVRVQLASGEIVIPGDQWPILVYENQKYDSQDPWKGLFRNSLLVYTFKHIFTSPSSVQKEVKATRSGNVRIHGMTRVTTASIAYVSTQLRFALSSSSTFCRSDTLTDSERFYQSIVEFLDDPEEKEEVDILLDWWNRQVFSSFLKREARVLNTSALARLKEARAKLLSTRGVMA